MDFDRLVIGGGPAGDVVSGLDQISHAMGEGGVAATTIRNNLCSQWPAFTRTPSSTDILKRRRLFYKENQKHRTRLLFLAFNNS